MRLIIDIKNKAKAGDILLFEEGAYKNVSLSALLKQYDIIIDLLSNRVLELENDNKNNKELINQLIEEIKILKGEE